jgi:hypothetical protein
MEWNDKRAAYYRLYAHIIPQTRLTIQFSKNGVVGLEEKVSADLQPKDLGKN